MLNHEKNELKYGCLFIGVVESSVNVNESDHSYERPQILLKMLEMPKTLKFLSTFSLFVLFSNVTLAGGWLSRPKQDLEPQPPSGFNKLDNDTLSSVLSFLSAREVMGNARVCGNTNQAMEQALKIISRDPKVIEVNKFLGNFIELPAVTADDVRYLKQAAQANPSVVRTSIQAPMPAFKASEAKTSIGLYKAVMGSYPDLTKASLPLSPEKRLEIYGQWDANPDLPAVYTTSTEDIAFAKKLSEITGRRFVVMSDGQNEYSIRGRARNEAGQAVGNIAISTYHFGDEVSEVQNHAYTFSNSGRQAHGVHEIPEGDNREHFKNSFGLIHPIGNVWARSADGALRGGVFSRYEWRAESSNSKGGCAEYRFDSIGFRLAEVFPRPLAL